MELQHYQDRVMSWKRAIMPQEDNTAEREMCRTFEEIHEFTEEVGLYDKSDESKERVAGEATDVIIRMFGVIGALGFDVEALIADKIETIYTKYNPEKVVGLQGMGLSFDEAMRTCKQDYENLSN